MIDIDLLTIEELITLNHRVVERLKFLQKARVHACYLFMVIPTTMASLVLVLILRNVIYHLTGLNILLGGKL